MAVQDQMATVGQVCRRQVDLVDASETAWDAAERMAHQQVDALVAVDTRQCPVGMVTSSLLVRRVLAADLSARTTRVHDIMEPAGELLPQEATAYWALMLMLERRASTLPVVDSAGRLVGILDLSDLLRSLKQIVKPLVEDPS